MANEDTGLNLHNLRSEDMAVEQLIDELDKQFNRNQIHLLTEEDSLEWEDIQDALFSDIRFVQYNGNDLPTSWEFVVEKAEGNDVRGYVEVTYTDFRVTRIVVDFPVGTRYADLQVNYKSGEPWKVADTELYFPRNT